jgi:hypothetical protein
VAARGRLSWEKRSGGAVKIDWIQESRRDSALLCHWAAVLLRIPPDEIGLNSDLRDYPSFHGAGATPEFRNVLEVAVSSIQAGKLRTIYNGSPHPYTYLIERTHFFEWAEEKGYVVPGELRQSKSDSISRAKTMRPDKSLSKIALALAMNTFKYDPSKERNEATGAIKAALDLYGLGLSHPTIKQCLDGAWELLSETEKKDARDGMEKTRPR